MVATYKRKYMLSIYVIGFLSITLVAVLFKYGFDKYRQNDTNVSDVGYSRNIQLLYTSPNEPKMISRQTEWDFRPSQNPRYENNTKVQQIGYLTMEKKEGETGEPKILPLFGQSMRYKNSDRWSYFTATDQYQSIRLPITYEGRDCMNNDTGCRELSTNDTVIIPSHDNRSFTVNLYNNILPHV